MRHAVADRAEPGRQAGTLVALSDDRWSRPPRRSNMHAQRLISIKTLTGPDLGILRACGTHSQGIGAFREEGAGVNLVRPGKVTPSGVMQGSLTAGRATEVESPRYDGSGSSLSPFWARNLSVSP